MTLSGQDFTVYAGDSFLLDFTVVDANGAAINLAGASLRWRLAPNARSRSLISKATGGGITVTDARNGRATVTLQPTDTAALAPGSYYHQLAMTDATGFISTLAWGTATVNAALR